MFDGFAFFDGFEVRVGVGGAVIFLLYFFKCCSLDFMHIAGMGVLFFVVLALEIGDDLSADCGIGLGCPCDVIFHCAGAGHAFEGIPCLPFGFGDHFPDGGFIGFAVSHCGLFVVGVEL